MTSLPASPVPLNITQTRPMSVSNRIACEASEIGFPPGFWPSAIDFVNAAGYHFTFRRGHIEYDIDRDIRFVEYNWLSTLENKVNTITVFND